MQNENTLRLRLGDKEIRNALIHRLTNSITPPKAIIEELHIHNGNAIADVVSLHSDAHCYEIKGEGDKIKRIEQQGYYYDLAFRKVTVVTTESHLTNAQKFAPAHWGIMIAREQYGTIKLSYIRAAKSNPKFDEIIALLTLWKSELNAVASNITDEKIAKLNRNNLAALIAENLNTDDLFKSISNQLIARDFKRKNPEPYRLCEH